MSLRLLSTLSVFLLPLLVCAQKNKGYKSNKVNTDLLQIKNYSVDTSAAAVVLADERFYPVEMPFTIDFDYALTVPVPEGYQIDELPKSLRLALNGKGHGTFDYRVSNVEGILTISSQVRILRATFTPEEYYPLREFFTRIVAKHKEKIVFKKKKK